MFDLPRCHPRPPVLSDFPPFHPTFPLNRFDQSHHSAENIRAFLITPNVSENQTIEMFYWVQHTAVNMKGTRALPFQRRDSALIAGSVPARGTPGKQTAHYLCVCYKTHKSQRVHRQECVPRDAVYMPNFSSVYSYMKCSVKQVPS